jgi:hypothetical protein
MTHTAVRLTLDALGPQFGADVVGFDLDTATDDELLAVRAALVDRKVLFFRDQRLDDDGQVRLGRRLGELTVSHPVVAGVDEVHPEIYALDSTDNGYADVWHTDAGELIGLAGDWRVSYIDCYDIAACGAALLTGPAPAPGTFVLTGPEALTQAEIAAKLSAAFGRPVGSVELSPDELAARLTARGMPARFAGDVAELWKDVAAGSLAGITPTVRRLTGADPRTFDEFLAAR